MISFFQTTEGMLALLLCMIALAFWVQKFKFFKTFGPALFVIILGIILVNLKIVPASHEIFVPIMNICVPMSISLYLLNVDLKAVAKLSKQPLFAIASAVFSVCLVAVVFGVIFGNRLDEGWKVAGMFVGTYTGGSPQLTAIATGLNATTQTIAAANAADYVVGMPVMLLMFAAPAYLLKSKKFNELWPYHFTEEELKGDETQKGFLDAEEWSIKEIAILLAISSTVVAVSTMICNMFGSEFASAARVLIISTISLILAQIPAVRKLRGNTKLGLFFGMTFLAVVGFSVDIKGFFGSAFNITLFCFCVVVGSLILHLVITRLMKIKYEYVLLGIVGAIMDGTTAALVASGAAWNSLIGIGLLMGILGGVCGNYVGIMVAYIVRALVGA